MNLTRYPNKINENFLDYQFLSEGPKGSIKKIVRFTRLTTHIYNLAFGDLNEKPGEISDVAITNNNDSRKVLATVAATVHDFTLRFAEVWIIAKGSTPSRTRLYRIGITNHWKEITVDFEVYGLKFDKWEPFKMRSDYSAFLAYGK